jgi:hypothetical protein
MTERGAKAIASLHPISRRISPCAGCPYCTAPPPVRAGACLRYASIYEDLVRKLR